MKIETKLTWKQAMPVFIEALKHGNPTQKGAATQELMRLAGEVDVINGKEVVEEKKVSKKRKKYTVHKQCAICGKMCKGNMGLGIHKSTFHGIKGPKNQEYEAWKNKQEAREVSHSPSQLLVREV